MYSDLISLVIKDVGRRKFSSFLTFFAISLGIFAIFLIILLSIGFERSIQAEFESLGTNRLYITPTGSNFGSSDVGITLTDSDLRFIENKPYIKKAYPYFFEVVQLRYGNEFERKQVLGVEFTESLFTDLTLEIDQGRLPRGENEKFSVILGPRAAEDLFDKEIPLGGNLFVNNTKFKVIGILESIGNPEDDNLVYFNVDTIREIVEKDDEIGIIYALVVDGYDVDLAKENLLQSLENRIGDDRVDVLTQAQLLDQFQTILGVVQYTLGGIALVSIVVGALGIINTMFVIVTEKTKDIGIMKSVGATNWDILFMYVFMAGFFGFMGALLGVIFGSFGAIGFEIFAKSSGFAFLEVEIDIMIALQLLLFGFLVGCFAGFVPARKASKITIVDTLRK